jgi:hypothetical protein
MMKFGCMQDFFWAGDMYVFAGVFEKYEWFLDGFSWSVCGGYVQIRGF